MNTAKTTSLAPVTAPLAVPLAALAALIAGALQIGLTAPAWADVNPPLI